MASVSQDDLLLFEIFDLKKYNYGLKPSNLDFRHSIDSDVSHVINQFLCFSFLFFETEPMLCPLLLQTGSKVMVINDPSFRE